jgi:hypothetical protein
MIPTLVLGDAQPGGWATPRHSEPALVDIANGVVVNELELAIWALDDQPTDAEWLRRLDSRVMHDISGTAIRPT